MIRYAIFDLDGTLLDTREGVISAAIQTFKWNDIPIPDEGVLESLIGPPIQSSFQTLFTLSNEESMKMANQFREYYRSEKFLYKAELYDGIYDLLNTLKKSGIKVGVATYKREDYALKLLKEKGFDKITPYMYGSDFGGKMKKCEIIKKCLSDMGCLDVNESVYIGDGDSDGGGATEVGMSFIAVTYGFGFKRESDALKYSPVGIASNCKDILNIIDRINSPNTVQ